MSGQLKRKRQRVFSQDLSSISLLVLKKDFCRLQRAERNLGNFKGEQSLSAPNLTCKELGSHHSHPPEKEKKS
jgi:hypothetical protein